MRREGETVQKAEKCISNQTSLSPKKEQHILLALFLNVEYVYLFECVFINTIQQIIIIIIIIQQEKKK